VGGAGCINETESDWCCRGCLIGEASMSKSLYYMIKLLIGERGMREVSDGSRIRQGFSPTCPPPQFEAISLCVQRDFPLVVALMNGFI